MNFFNLPIPPPPFSSLLSPDSYTLHSLFLSRKTRRCTSSSSSFSFLFVGLSATPPSPSRVLCGNQRPSLISLIRRRDESELSVDSLRCRRAPFFWLYAESDCHFDDPKDFYEKIDITAVLYKSLPNIIILFFFFSKSIFTKSTKHVYHQQQIERPPNKYMYSRTQCIRLPLYAGSGRGECRLALPPFMERGLPSLEPETYRSWAKALTITPSATSIVSSTNNYK
ncbi:hypothetical protein DVH24_016269 [Malus domestica]|uniref:Uncharacterized protein n=1 Tax=Malus domestica TaxID=3750 RepID=A0A498HVB1_MALDO|nr:hypothetical protein DVH24_016269 [Malus domestica]